MSDKEYTYLCCRVEKMSESDWDNVAAIELVDTVSGGLPRLHTVLKACWTREYVHFRFECEDDHTVASFTKRDDPLYDEDVVEIFIDETGDGRSYKEFEVSPANALFDAQIQNNLAGSIVVQTEWDAEGIQTEVRKAGERILLYHITIPCAVFDSPPKAGLSWRVNFYRIDEDQEGHRHYWAWSPTGKINYHIPHKFGRLLFMETKS